jgi:hypothetical protein
MAFLDPILPTIVGYNASVVKFTSLRLAFIVRFEIKRFSFTLKNALTYVHTTMLALHL